MQHICIAGHETDYVMLEVMEEKKEKVWNRVKVQVKWLRQVQPMITPIIFHCLYREHLNNFMVFPSHPSHPSLPPLATCLTSHLLFVCQGRL